MSDSINGLGRPVDPGSARSSGNASNATRSAEATTADGARARSTGADRDSVNLTETARQLQALTRTASSEGAVDRNQVNAIRQTLDSGQYAIDSRQIAERLLQFDN